MNRVEIQTAQISQKQRGQDAFHSQERIRIEEGEECDSTAIQPSKSASVFNVRI